MSKRKTTAAKASSSNIQKKAVLNVEGPFKRNSVPLLISESRKPTEQGYHPRLCGMAMIDKERSNIEFIEIKMDILSIV